MECRHARERETHSTVSHLTRQERVGLGVVNDVRECLRPIRNAQRLVNVDGRVTAHFAVSRIELATTGAPARIASSDRGATLARPRRKDEPGDGPHLAPIRQRIESIFWTCKDLLTLERHGARTLKGLRERVLARFCSSPPQSRSTTNSDAQAAHPSPTPPNRAESIRVAMLTHTTWSARRHASGTPSANLRPAGVGGITTLASHPDTSASSLRSRHVILRSKGRRTDGGGRSPRPYPGDQERSRNSRKHTHLDARLPCDCPCQLANVCRDAAKLWLDDRGVDYRNQPVSAESVTRPTTRLPR